MHILFVKPTLAWPRSSGHDVYCYYMMRGLVEQGASVSLLTVTPTAPAAVEGISLETLGTLDECPPGREARPLTRLQERFRSFWGVEVRHIRAVAEMVRAERAAVVVAFGLPTLPYLGSVDDALRVWAMADEWVYHHLSLIRLRERSTWPNVKAAAIKGLYERAYSPLVDRAWAVSDTDARAGRWLAGMRQVDLLPNGVDTVYYAPMAARETANSAVFWGRLDFEPNVDAVVWFCKEVWPAVRERVPDAQFTIMGYQPTRPVEQLAHLPGVRVLPNVADIREAVCAHEVVVLPMISGGGIKNKLLEGAAMARPIVCTSRAALDLKPAGQLPLAIASRPADWVDEITRLWRAPERRTALGREAREWVAQHYSWTSSAAKAFQTFSGATAPRIR